MEQIENLMRRLGCTEQEAKQIIEDDKRIDKGEKLFELSTDQKQASKKARAVGRVPGVYKFSRKERKPDHCKRNLIAKFAEVVEGLDLEIINPEREFTFVYAGKKYKIVLSAPRS